MIKRMIQDYAALLDMFQGMPPEKERKVKVAVRQMIETEAYQYVKYCILGKAVSRMQSGLNNGTHTAKDYLTSAYEGENIAKSLDIKEQPKRKIHFRGENSNSSS